MIYDGLQDARLCNLGLFLLGIHQNRILDVHRHTSQSQNLATFRGNSERMQNFLSQILEIIEWLIFRLVASFIKINYFNGECSGRLISRLGNLGWPSRSRDVVIWGLFLLGKHHS